VAAGRRSSRDERRRRLGQNFLLPGRAERLVADAALETGELVVEIGAGRGAVTHALARTGAEVVAVEVDPVWAARLRQMAAGPIPGNSAPGGPVPGSVRVVEADFLTFHLPRRPFRVVGSIPFGQTTAILHHLLDDPEIPLRRADLVVQHEVARKRAAVPPATLLSTVWAPWWELRCGPRIPGADFRPVPKVDAAVLTVTRRDPPLLPPGMAGAYGDFVRAHWPFPTR
jgi:23S rRNA (adenine-N6)-dimethyltransferase